MESRSPQCVHDLQSLISIYGRRRVARLLAVKPKAIEDCLRRLDTIEPSVAKRIIDLHIVLMRAFKTFNPKTTSDWLVGREPLLGGAHPIDVLVMRGAAPLLEALDGIDAGGYA